MRRSFAVLLAGFVLGALVAVPAWAGVDDSNPNAVGFGPAVCDNGLEFDLIYSPTDQSVVGQDTDSNITGVAKALWVATEGGDKVLLLTRPINEKLERLTVFCWWPAPTLTGYVGGDILFRNGIR